MNCGNTSITHQCVDYIMTKNFGHEWSTIGLIIFVIVIVFLFTFPDWYNMFKDLNKEESKSEY